MMITSSISQVLRRWLTILLAVIVAITLYSCSPAHSNLVARLVVPTPSGPATFNSPLNQSAYDVFGYLYEGLLNQNGVTSNLEPGLAESWEVSKDGKKIVFTLREGLKWSDGEPFTTDDIIFTYDGIYLNDKIPSSLKDILRVGVSRQFPKVKKLDSRRVEFSVAEPFAPFIRFAGGLPILPAHILAESVRTTDADGKPLFLSTWGTNTDPKKIIGNGQYRMASYTPNQRVILERNPYYWRKDTQGNSLPYIEQIVWQIMENTDTQLLNFRSGDLDTLDVQPEAFPLLKREEKRGKYTIYNGGPDSGTVFLAFNLNQGRNAKNKPFVDPIKSRWFNIKEFRQAIAYGINRDAMTNNIYRGLGAPLHSPIPVQSPFYLSPEKGLKTYNYNPEKAKQLLLDAGFKYNSEGQLLDAQSNKVRFTVLASAGKKVREQMASQIKQDLGKLGMQIDTQFLSFNTYVEKLRLTRDWDTYLGGFTGGGVEPHGGYNVWSVKGTLHSFNQPPQPGEPAIKDWVVADWEQKIDDLYVQASQELNEAKRKEIYAETQRITTEQMPFVYMVNPLTFEAVRDRISGIKYSAIGGAFWNLYELKITE
ncbi:ABC transporter substrate-binding protein [Kamptonema animale CS-326]|jgi:peptide/nickel transport system substrate-binding protein|uniref:ABC transporter substrate-binding protein n=1 Tax=Kamptonema animale TaxID=92934 RepID=UPI00232D3B0A|nr:ABC transporter substrate-binding protein [Kamptonema animale]MDB9510147.1 ABC transporter substrate-binding protein [Kamptonema animale CS-326]